MVLEGKARVACTYLSKRRSKQASGSLEKKTPLQGTNTPFKAKMPLQGTNTLSKAKNASRS